MKKEVENCFTWLVNNLAETTLYDWEAEYSKEKNKELLNKFCETLKKHIDFNNITIKEAKELRFRKWSEEYPDLWLFPLYLLPIIPEGLEVIDIDGYKHKFKSKEADNDNRFGCLPFGINIKS